MSYLRPDESDQLYRLIIDNALDSFIAIDEQSRIVEWSLQAERTFGWTREEACGLRLIDTIIPERHHAAHLTGMAHFLETGEATMLGKRVELSARRKDGSEIPVELSVTPIPSSGRMIFSASLRDISSRKQLEKEVRAQEHITQSILDSMADAVVVADVTGRIIVMNAAGQRLLHVRPVDGEARDTFLAFALCQPDGRTPYAPADRPLARALRGEHVNGLIAYSCHPEGGKGRWISANARPMVDGNGVLIGAVVVFHDITELRKREEALAQQARLLQEQASLLDLSHDAILVRSPDHIITYWNRSAERLYKYTREEAIGRVCHELLQTQYPQPLEEIQKAIQETQYWEGELVHVAKDGRELVVFSQWSLELQDGRPLRYLETNADITQRIQTEKALRQAQENYQLLVEASTDYAIMMMDPHGTIISWNSGAEKMLGLSTKEAVGKPVSDLFTPEDRGMGEPSRELIEAEMVGRSEDDRWHLRRDGSRFWAVGVVTPMRNEDGSLRGFVKIMRDQTAHRLVEEQTQFLANHDVLTGLPNRVSFSSRLHQAIAMSERTKAPLSVLLLDLDRFKHVNDTFGHHVGDLLLKEVAMRILSSLRETDFVARLGGDEFVLIQTDVSQPEAAETLARKIIIELGRPYYLDGNEVIGGTSIGISTYPTDAKSSVELLKKSDLALYRAKSAGRGTYQVYTADIHMERNWKKDRELALRNALKNREFELYYQPQIDLNNWTISTVEALLRWQATELELVLPNDFLAIAEETGLIVEIGDWALREACRQVKNWQEQGMPELRISVNCSARQFSNPQFVKMIRPILEETGLASNSLEIEIAESMLTKHPDIKRQLTELRALGVRITIDNYGTGSNALIDLKEFEVDGLKIDKAFVQHLPHRRKDSAITSAIINLAHNLGIGVSAGGVETAEQLAYLKARDCTSAQGFIFSPPVPAEKFEEIMLSGHWSRINRPPSLGEGVVFKDFH
ncbi:MAG TPA: PAS domain S-box protein [Noviherbaspirillum sp.]|uniref:sensor domain-containing protein n=1 Tax=Noviherbaspirillum sp. TaxID=1926288 RepID=UPI002DDD53CE|nr:PAS domain S-box protein [Noviherbaspirillum sp.]HEV2610536.1 PAS domain S-box protein [Noviherbaspirillum sp.]